MEWASGEKPTQTRLVFKALLRVAWAALSKIVEEELKKIGTSVESRLDPAMLRVTRMSCVVRGHQLSWTTCRTRLSSKKKKRGPLPKEELQKKIDKKGVQPT